MRRLPMIGIVIAAALQGGYMLFDGIHKLVTGGYFGQRVGPWAYVVSELGISADSMGPVLVSLGTLWLAAMVGLLLGFGWSRWLLGVLATASLLYVPFGTFLSIAVLVLLLWGKKSRA